MKLKSIILFFFIACLFLDTLAQKDLHGFSFHNEPSLNRIDLTYNGQLITSYCYVDSVSKPFLFPVNTIDGITVTRGYPITPVRGESTDHPHHTGSWMNYESVNGLDFWNNSTAITADKKNNYGTIRHTGVLTEKAVPNHAILVTTANWLRPDGKCLIKETTHYQFTVKDSILIIDRITDLTAQDLQVDFNDAKDGFFAIRVAKELEQPAQQPQTFSDIHGNKTTVKQNSDAATGHYISSEGLTGDSVWGTRGRWVMLRGKKDGKAVTIGMADHPQNVGYPSYWHARGYGLFAVNPLGQKIFSNGKEQLNFSLKPHQHTYFRYRLIIASKEITTQQMDELANAFSKTALIK